MNACFVGANKKDIVVGVEVFNDRGLFPPWSLIRNLRKDDL